MAMKVVLKTIQFKRGPIDKLPKEAKYGEPILVHDEEGKYYLYVGLGEGKAPVLVSGAGGGGDVDLTEVEDLINKALEDNDNKLKTEFKQDIEDVSSNLKSEFDKIIEKLKTQVEEDIDGAIEIYIGDNEELASERDIWINEHGVPDGMIEVSSIRENVNELNDILNELTGLDTILNIDEDEYVFEDDVVEAEQLICKAFDSLNLE